MAARERLAREADHVVHLDVCRLLERLDEIRAQVALPRAAERRDDDASALRVDRGRERDERGEAGGGERRDGGAERSSGHDDLLASHANRASIAFASSSRREAHS